jgi:hypothetical protein
MGPTGRGKLKSRLRSKVKTRWEVIVMLELSRRMAQVCIQSTKALHRKHVIIEPMLQFH